MSAISITLKAIDEYSGVLTGLNQGFELVGKGIAAMQAVGELAFAAVEAGIGLVTDAVELAGQGGNYTEMRRQFNNVAESFRVDGDSIIEDLNKISVNMVSLADQTRIAGKAIISGLDQEQIATVFEFVKRRTEMTGESFEAMSEKIFTAFASGKFTPLEKLGIEIDKDETQSTAIRRLELALVAYGDAGFNTTDKINALKNAQNSFTTALGVAINESPTFQKAMTGITDAVWTMLDKFDPRPITEFFEAMYDFGSIIIDSLIDIIPGLRDIYNTTIDFFSNSMDSSEQFSVAVVNVVFGIVRSVAEGINSILDLLETTGILTAVEFIVSAFVDTIRLGLDMSIGLVGRFVSYVIDTSSSVISAIGEMARNSPMIAEAMGLDPEGLAMVENGLNKAGRSVDGFMDAWDNVDEGLDIAQEFNAALADGIRNFKIDTDSLDRIEEDMKDRISDIDFSQDWKDALGIGEGIDPEAYAEAQRQSDAITAEFEKARADEEAWKRQKKEDEAADKKAIAKELADQKKAEREAIAAEKKAEREAIAERAKAEREAIAQAKKEVDAEMKRADAIEKESKMNWADRREAVAKREAAEAKAEADKIKKQALLDEKLAKLGLDAEKKKNTPDVEKKLKEDREKEIEKAKIERDKVIADQWMNVNWPEEFQALGEFLFRWTLAKARDEDVPLAIITGV